MENGKVKIFSRNQEDNTSKYPDIISRIQQVKKDSVTSFILDCEAVAWDKENNAILPFQVWTIKDDKIQFYNDRKFFPSPPVKKIFIFQVLIKRKRKDVAESDIKVPVCVYMFDLLYLNGKPLVKEKFIDRRRLLQENFNEVLGEWTFAKSIDTTKMEEVCNGKP